jgi:hypothetical protein
MREGRGSPHTRTAVIGLNVVVRDVMTEGLRWVGLCLCIARTAEVIAALGRRILVTTKRRSLDSDMWLGLDAFRSFGPFMSSLRFAYGMCWTRASRAVRP